MRSKYPLFVPRKYYMNDGIIHSGTHYNVKYKLLPFFGFYRSIRKFEKLWLGLPNLVQENSSDLWATASEETQVNENLDVDTKKKINSFLLFDSSAWFVYLSSDYLENVILRGKLEENV